MPAVGKLQGSMGLMLICLSYKVVTYSVLRFSQNWFPSSSTDGLLILPAINAERCCLPVPFSKRQFHHTTRQHFIHIYAWMCPQVFQRAYQGYRPPVSNDAR